VTPAAADEPVRIRCAADLFSVLCSGPMEAQLAVLKSVVDDPRRPLTLGRHQGEDFIDLLLRLVPESTGTLKQLQILCLMSYQDPRTTEFMVDEFGRSRDAATVLQLGKRLDLERGFDFFRPFLWDDRPAQRLAAARLCSHSPELSVAERLRVAILLDEEYAPPEISVDTMDVWLSELAGRYRLRARALAEATGSGVLGLWQRWSELRHEEQLWLVQVSLAIQDNLVSGCGDRTLATAGVDLSLPRQKLGELLSDPEVPYAYVELALRHGVELPAALLNSEQPLVRAAAIGCGHADDRLGRFLSADTSLPETLAAAPRCSVEEQLRLLADPRWQVRAVATDLLARAEAPPLEALHRKTSSEILGERVAAVEILQRLGNEDWLESNL
jgi:hypothetical protein